MARKVCAQAGCRKVTTTRNCPSCQSRIEMKQKEHAKTRARKSQVNMDDRYKAFYRSSEWSSLRTRKIQKDPLCEDCLDRGFIREGKDIDHIVEVKDDYSKRLDITNLRTLCRSCHVHKTHRVRRERMKS